MTPIQKLLLRYIQENAKDNQINMSNAKLAKELGVCSSSIFKCIKALRESGVINVVYDNRTRRAIVLV